jgi:radical SAM protein with 4Fe4S-binding SPASM domain
MNKLIPIISLITQNFIDRPRLSSNYIKACFSAVLKSAIIKNAPISVNIEPTTVCNLKCITCDRTYKSDINLGMMSFNVFKEVVSQFSYLLGSNYIQTGLFLTGLGEPFLNKDIFRMIKYAKQKGQPYVHLISNGTVLDETKNQEIINCELDHISFSIDGSTKETFESIRVGAKYESVISSIKNLTGKRCGKKPFIDLNITLEDKNQKEWMSFIDLAFDVRADRVSVRLVSQKLAHNNIARMHVILNDIKKAEQYAKSKKIEFRYTDDYKDTCVYPWIWPYVTWNGFVTPCCYISDPRQFNFGNILEKSFMDIWNGDKYCQFRKDLVSTNPPSICKDCPKCPSNLNFYIK